MASSFKNIAGVEAVAIHGGKDQEERTRGVKAFKNHEKDVLVATDVASKGLDFPDIKHVINYDMPEDIENYGEFSPLMTLSGDSIFNEICLVSKKNK